MQNIIFNFINHFANIRNICNLFYNLISERFKSGWRVTGET